MKGVVYSDPLDRTEDALLLVHVRGYPTIRIGPYPLNAQGRPIAGGAPCLQFTPTGGNDEYGEITGQMRLTASLWARWFKGKGLFPGFQDLPTAIATLLEDPQIYLACPVCEFRTKDAGKLEEHIAEHKRAL